MPTGAQKMAETLLELGVDHIFGIPGGATGAIFNAFYGKGDKMRVILARHEQSAAIMADAYGRLTGKPAVVMGQGAFIGTSGGFGIMEAYLSHSPMLVITDTSDGGFWQLGNNQEVSGEYGTADLLSILRSMTKYTSLATTPNEAVLGVQLAAKHATSGAPGPAAVLLRTQASFGQFDTAATPRIHASPGYLSTVPATAPLEAVRRVVQALARAERPVIIAGNGVHIARAHDELRQLAELYAIPVTTTYKGKSAIEETHPLSVGPMGIYGIETANRIVSEADVVLVVGARLRPQDTASHHPNLLDPARQRILQIDVEPRNAGWTVPVELGLAGDAKAVLVQVLEAASAYSKDPAEREQKVVALAERKKQLKFFEDSPGIHSDQKPVLPQRLVRLLQESVDPSTIITLDAGNNRGWMYHFYQSQRPATFLNPGGIAGMGWAIPAAVGAKEVYRDRPVMAVTGDGGFVMTSNAISTAVQYDLPIVAVVLNDGGLGMVRENQRPNLIASEFVETDHAKIGEAYGGWGVQVKDPRDLPAAIHDAFKAGRPAVVDVITDRFEGFHQFRAGVSEFARR
ncbi:MAG: thiamine pyrophosphate-binding protein [Chloroflexi bacterium]|nr:thiamine pyrophosphate-binding protein [Chloroflexota bacterium]